MSTLTSLTLRDALREAMKKENHSPEDVASLADCSVQTVNNFLSGRVTEPTSDIRGKFEDYCSAYGMTRSAIMQKMTGKKKKQSVAYVLHALKVLRHLMTEGKVSVSEFYKESGIADGSRHALWHGEHKVVSTNVKRMMKWFEQRYGITVDKMNQMMITGTLAVADAPTGGVVESQDEKGNTVFTNPGMGNHYVCSYLDDWESASVISSIMGNSSLPETEKKKLLGKLFAQEFPTLS